MLAAASLGYAAYAIRQHERTHALAKKRDATRGGGGKEAGRWKPIALAAASCVVIVPFTWAFLAPTSDVLWRETEGGVGTGMAEGVLKDMVVRWAWICAARAVLPLVGTAVGVWSLLGW